MATHFRAAAPILQVGDVAATMRWYEEQLGFRAHPFPAAPPHVFCILGRDQVEIMLQRVDDFTPLDVYRRRDGGVWHAYLRVEGLVALHDDVRQRPAVTLLEPLSRQPYGDSEFVVRDPNGYVLVFSELIASPPAT